MSETPPSIPARAALPLIIESKGVEVWDRVFDIDEFDRNMERYEAKKSAADGHDISTPRTEACFIASARFLDSGSRMKEFARTLERELNAARAALTAIEKFGHGDGHGMGYSCADMAKRALDTASGPA